jgi:hypothetical protein
VGVSNMCSSDKWVVNDIDDTDPVLHLPMSFSGQSSSIQQLVDHYFVPGSSTTTIATKDAVVKLSTFAKNGCIS